jgi:hypothetical protein
MSYNNSKTVFEKIKLTTPNFSTSSMERTQNIQNKTFVFLFLMKSDLGKAIKTLGSVEIPLLYIYKQGKEIYNAEPYNLIDFNNDDYSLIGKVKVNN